jgi:hypothetical protein
MLEAMPASGDSWRARFHNAVTMGDGKRAVVLIMRPINSNARLSAADRAMGTSVSSTRLCLVVISACRIRPRTAPAGYIASTSATPSGGSVSVRLREARAAGSSSSVPISVADVE